MMLTRMFMRQMYSSSGRKPIHATAEVVSKTPVNHDCYLYKLKFVDRSFDLHIGEHFRMTETIKTYENSEG
jgi:hypothetical protein